MAGRTRRMKSLGKTINNNEGVSTGQPDEQQEQYCLPTELWTHIISLLTLKDNIRASGVCKTWKNIATSVRVVEKPPWLMYSQKSGDIYEFYDPSQRKLYCLEFPELRDCRFSYAKDGWLLMYNDSNKCYFFFCPCTREIIELPKLGLLHQIVCFSASPKSSNCIVFRVNSLGPMVVSVSTCSPGATEWTTIKYQNQQPFSGSRWDKIVFCRDIFCCLAFDGAVGVYNPQNSTWTVHSAPPPKSPENLNLRGWWRCKLMAEHNGHIFVIHPSDENPIIYKLDERNGVWVEMERLGGTTFFAHYLCSHARTDLPGNMRNNIYFPKVRIYGRRCVSYSLEDGRYHPRNKIYNWCEDNPFRSIWIDAPEDFSKFLSANNVKQ